ncbi:MAG: hypothetical protein QGI46_11320 [Planctomycetota bacterium]|jgi:hypothetical protein|nr:hypothetical protein [Planctomycetota bacterium]
MTTTQQLRGAPIDTMDCLRRGASLCGDQYWLLVVMGALFMLIVNAQTALLPLPILLGPLTCGMYSALRARSRGERIVLGRLFDGFRCFGTAFLASLLHLLVLLVTAIPFGMALGLCGSIAGVAFGNGAEVVGACLATLFGLIGLALAVALLIANTLILFTYPLIMERGLSAAAALAASARGVRRHIGSLIVLNAVLALLTSVAYLALILPGLLVFPVSMAATWVAYRHVFPEEAAVEEASSGRGVAPIGEA